MPAGDDIAGKTYTGLSGGLSYDEEACWPGEGVKPGTVWDDVPVNWVCPGCDARKEDFELVEI